MLETAKIIDGKKIAEDIKSELKEEIEKFTKENSSRKPCLAVILVGDDPASHYYVKNKEKACDLVGIDSKKTVLSADTSKEDLIKEIQSLNDDKEVDGILLQLPLPDALRAETQEIVDTIGIDKDVDGLTTLNLGRVFTNDTKAIYPCTPKGCMELLKRYHVETLGKRALVIGRSTLVGKPISILLNNANATVTMAHSRTQNLQAECSMADIVIAAAGKAKFIQGEWLKEGAVVIDVGINAITHIGSEGEERRKLVGDVDFDSAKERAGLITPVPGGVGPMTVAMLLSNTFELYQRHVA
ncbi:MAG: bifunctional methylenetetrahydrofolate dehydrogenase/methenyltetrahydrofolate cyclohydrolase FolD [Candidatus Caenarcaniphilales bacterium]|nr:bifunctional methylenetetrahydrofolate dehydrogenase/methenyltetrahydrofolate cyclohydrolase FolD [Candidatus Caenarcaniphilales bacterium]